MKNSKLTAKQKKFLKNLVSAECLGDLGAACELSGIDRSQYCKWYDCSDEFRKATVDTVTMMARSQLPDVFKTILELITVKKDPKLIKLYLDLTGNEATGGTESVVITGEELL